LSEEHCEIALSLAPGIAYPYALASLTEAAAFIQHVQIQHEVGKEACFAGLSSAEKDDLVPDDIHSFLERQTAWHGELESFRLRTVLSGLQHAQSRPVQVHHLDETAQALVRCLLEHVPACWQGHEKAVRDALIALSACKREPEVSSLVKQESEPQAVDAGMTADIEASLLQPYPKLAPSLGSKLHVGTLLHGLVELLRDAFGCDWPQHCIAMIASTAESTLQLRFQQEARHLLAILATDSHWAMVAGRRGEGQLLLFDSRPSQLMDDTAVAAVSHLQTQGFCDDASLMRVHVPRQTDDWSCGHRLLAAARCVIGAVQRPDCDWPPVLSKKGFSDDALTDTVAYLQKKWQGGSQKAVKPKQAAPAVLQLVSDDDDDEDDGADQADERVKQEENAAPATPRKKPERCRSRSPVPEKQAKNKTAPKAKAKTSKGIKGSKKQLLLRENLDANPSGHWGQFCEQLAAKTPMRCTSCQMLRAIILKQQAQQMPLAGDDDASGGAVVPADADDAAEAMAPARRGRGRPPKGQDVPSLEAWVQRERKGTYRIVVGNTWKCLRCAKEIDCRRQAESGKTYLMDHERSRLHRRLHDPDAGPLPDQEVPCGGVTVGSGAVPQLDRYVASFEKWVQSGQLAFAAAPASDPLGMISVSWQAEDLMLRHKQCLGVKGGDAAACSKCLALTGSRALHTAACRWAFRIDLAGLGRALALETQEQQSKQRELMMSADYGDIAEVRKELDEVMAAQDDDRLFRMIKGKFQAIPSSRQSERLTAWLDAVLVYLSDKAGPDTERAAYQTLCASFKESLISGKVQHSDLDMAAKVASGGLHAHKVVRCLMASFFASQEKIARGATSRPGTSQFFTDETAREIFFELGWSSGTRKMLSFFGVASKNIQPSVDYRLPLVPWPFRAHLNPDDLSHNCEVTLQHLNVRGSRSFLVSIDETYMHPTFSLMTGLCPEAPECVIGGFWSEDNDRSLLTDTKNLPSEHLARMTLHFIVSRSDSFQQTFDVMCFPVKPKATAKAEHQLSCLGKILLRMTENNDNIPPLGASFDGGATNLLTGRAFLAQLSRDEMAGFEFFRDCDKVFLPEAKYFNYGVLRYRGFYLHGSQDPLHWFKRFSLQHCTGSRTVTWGSVGIDTIGMLELHLPLRAFVLADEQSDKQGLQRMSSRYLGNRWNHPGVHLFCLLGALVSSATLGGDDNSASERMYAAFVAYYLLLLNYQSARLLWRNQWQKHFLPAQTLKLGLQLLAHAILLARFGANEASVLPSRFAERAAELHFSSIKKGYRGTPSLRDLLVGTHKHHLEHAKIEGKPGKPSCQQVSAEMTGKISEEALKRAILWQSWTSVNRKPQQIKQEFDNWWKKEGIEWLDASGEDGCDDGELLAQDDAMEDQGEEEDEASMALQSAEDHAHQKAEILNLLSPADKASTAEMAEALGTEASAIAGDSSEHVIPAMPEVDKLSFRQVVAMLSDTEEFDMEDEDSTTYASCLARLHGLQTPVRKYIQYVRLQEGMLSAAQILGTGSEDGDAPKLSRWQLLEHELALARQAGSLDGARQSRWSGWMQVQSKVVQWTKQGLDSEKPQVLLYKTNEGMEGEGDQLHLGLVQSIYRGAKLKGKDESRKMRVTKPGGASLPATTTSRVRLMHLTNVEDGKYFTCSLSSLLLLDPINSILAEVPVQQIGVTANKTVLWFSPEVLQCIQKIRENPSLLAGDAPVPEPAASSDDAAVSTPCGQTMYTASSFSRTIAGTKCIQQFLRELPARWTSAGLSFLDSQGYVQVPKSKTRLLWEEVVRRSPEMLDIALAGQSQKQFGSAVLTRFRAMLPGAADAKTSVLNLVGQVDQMSLPAFGAQSLFDPRIP
ncbi:unnamed protein product, partial [Symbiodinium microadriaticum]